MFSVLKKFLAKCLKTEPPVSVGSVFVNTI